jgi:hypothetical protein
VAGEGELSNKIIIKQYWAINQTLAARGLEEHDV